MQDIVEGNFKRFSKLLIRRLNKGYGERGVHFGDLDAQCYDPSCDVDNENLQF